MRAGLPRDFDELVRFHGAMIASAAPEDVLLIAHHLWYRGVIENFRPPRELTRNEVIAYLGLPASAWYAIARARPHVLPQPIEGSLTSRKSRYHFSDAERCLTRRDELFPRLRLSGFFRSIVPGFDQFLNLETKKLVDELELGYIFDVPPDLPQTDEDMARLYSAAVARIVRCRVKFGIDVEDAIGEIWVKLLNSNLLVKFMRSGPKRLPVHLTTEEALDYLGVEWKTWRRMLATHSRAPNPVKGSSDSLDALYRSEDIRALDESGYFKKRGLRFLPAACVSRPLFDRYVVVAAEHALKNLFRTLDRRYNREDTLQEGTYIQDNQRVRHSRREDSDSQAWEDSLSSTAIAADCLLDIKRRALTMTQTA